MVSVVIWDAISPIMTSLYEIILWLQKLFKMLIDKMWLTTFVKYSGTIIPEIMIKKAQPTKI